MYAEAHLRRVGWEVPVRAEQVDRDLLHSNTNTGLLRNTSYHNELTSPPHNRWKVILIVTRSRLEAPGDRQHKLSQSRMEINRIETTHRHAIVVDPSAVGSEEAHQDQHVTAAERHTRDLGKGRKRVSKLDMGTREMCIHRSPLRKTHHSINITQH